MRIYSVTVALGLLLAALIGLQFLASPTNASSIEASVNIVPQVFNLNQHGVLTAIVSNLTEDGVAHDVQDIDVSSIRLYYQDSLITEALRTTIENDILYVKFDSTIVANYIWSNIVYHMGIVPPQMDKMITLTVRGQLSSGQQFAGSDTIKITLPSAP